MTEELVEIEVDGQTIQARKGSMLIEATDSVGVDVPRFCYHKHLSVAANCRMCLVDVENAPKPLPACATPVSAGMKVRTNSARALDAQRGTMEFLLINHPLDCPVCDQGGECELQDVALGYGEGVSRFTEGKRVVADEDIGPLIATDMTRCIHCTRCVRFGTEVAGVRELGATGRGEDMRIGTYVGRAVSSEMSGNVIDLCPVGALTNKPARYTMRPWELIQQATVSPHDSIGSNLFLHTRLGRVMRAVPRENTQINETWIADRDRYSHFGMYSADRVEVPLVRRKGIWEEASWEVALEAAAEALQAVCTQHGASALGTLVSPAATVEEQFLAQRLTRSLGSPHIDSRLRHLDFSDQDRAPVMPWLGQEISDLESLDSVLLIGSNIRKEQPLAAHRLRKGVLANGTSISFVNARRFDFVFEDTERQLVHAPDNWVQILAGIASAVAQRSRREVPADVKPLTEGVAPDELQQAVAESLCTGERVSVLLGSQAESHAQLAVLRRLAAVIAELADARFGYLPGGGNACGAWLAGCLPHRTAGGQVAESVGDDARTMLAEPRKAYLLVGVDPEFDTANPVAAVRALESAEAVVAVSAFTSDALLQHAHVILPGTTFAETDGTFVNAAGLWQPFRAAGNPPGEARAGWKVLRILAEYLGLEDLSWVDVDGVRSTLREACAGVVLDNRVEATDVPLTPVSEVSGMVRFGHVPMYSTDPLVRRSAPLQAAADAGHAEVRLHSRDVADLGLEQATRVLVRQQGQEQVLPLVVDDDVARGCAWLPMALNEMAELTVAHGPVELKGI